MQIFELDFSELKVSKLIQEDVKDYLDPQKTILSRKQIGGTAPSQVKKEIKKAKLTLEEKIMITAVRIVFLMLAFNLISCGNKVPLSLPDNSEELILVMKTIDGQLFVENIPVIELAKEYGSPLFIYSSKEIENNFLNYKKEIREKDLVCYAVKANSNIHILKALSDLGSGFDVVSGNELQRCLSWSR